MLRIHFSAEDLGRIRVAATVDPLWEMVFSRLRLAERGKGLVFEPWVRHVRQNVGIATLRPGLRVLAALSSVGRCFPDFLAPPEGALGPRPAIGAIRATPRSRLRHELRVLSTTTPLPGWTRSLAEGDTDLLESVTDSLVAYHRAVIEPHADTIQAAVEADRAHRAGTMLDHGAEALLFGMRPLMQWRPPVLEVQYDHDRDLHLGGRGLRLVPSYFCRRTPVALADPDSPPTLVYPVNHDYTWKRQLSSGRRPERALATLLGSTRSAVLAAIGRGATTTDLACRLGTSPSSVSRHTTVLREAGIISSYRHGPSVVHTTTPLGAALLRQRPLHHLSGRRG